MTSEASKLHQEAIVIDAVCPILIEQKHVDDFIAGGFTAVAPTVGGSFSAEETLAELGRWVKFIRDRDDLLLVRTAEDVRRAKQQGKLGIVFHFQGTEPLENKIDYVDAFKEIGVGIIQLAYNVKNRICDGCEERTDAGLSKFGLQVIKRMNDARVIVDCSHTGYRSTMEAIEASEAPVVFSHANPKAVYASQRNITDEQIKAVAATGGLVGAVGCAFFVGTNPRPSLEEYIAHIDYMVQLVGIDHVGIGIDYWKFQHPYTPDDVAVAKWEENIAVGRWSEKNYPKPPYIYPKGIETPDKFENLTSGLLARGYQPDDVKKILGGNWVRVYEAVWGS